MCGRRMGCRSLMYVGQDQDWEEEIWMFAAVDAAVVPRGMGMGDGPGAGIKETREWKNAEQPRPIVSISKESKK